MDRAENIGQAERGEIYQGVPIQDGQNARSQKGSLAGRWYHVMAPAAAKDLVETALPERYVPARENEGSQGGGMGCCCLGGAALIAGGIMFAVAEKGCNDPDRKCNMDLRDAGEITMIVGASVLGAASVCTAALICCAATAVALSN